jgi:hypothetical protein
MPIEQNHDAKTQGEPPSWAWPVHAFVVSLAAMLDYITRFKRIRHTHRFRHDWRDNWEGLRESEWHRDQLIAQGAAQLLASKPLQLDDTKIQLIAPAGYGGPCPRTPFDMNRRFLALARWAADPEAIIRARFRRVSRNTAAAHGSTDALRGAHHEAVSVVALKNDDARLALRVSSDRRVRPSNYEAGLTKARGPPCFANYKP